MRIGIIGGTGDLGRGLSLRWAKNHTIFIGSRFKEKAERIADEYNKIAKDYYKMDVEIVGLENKKAVEKSELVVLSIPAEFIKTIVESFKAELSGKIIISPIVPMRKEGNNFIYIPPPEGSAALLLRKIVPETTKIVAAFHNLSAIKLAELGRKLDYDVVMCGDTEAKSVVSELIKEIENLRPLDGGPLENAYLIESLTPLLLNVAIRNKLKLPSIKFVL
ncbi:MAG: NADPH-dependent F420 reductase [Candidatus Asgardarchaeia archaeon]